MSDPLTGPLEVIGDSKRWRELLVGRDVVGALLRSPRLRSAPRGDGSAVVMVPGIGTDDRVLWPLRRYITSLGYRVETSDLGRVSGDVQEMRDRLLARLIDLGDGPFALVGWSIGGVISREVARDRPDLVSQVITFGSPINGGPRYSAAARYYSDAELDHIDELIAERNQTPIEVPITAIWSTGDGVVPPPAAYDDLSPDVEHVQVRATHVGLGIDHQVWRIIADRLATDRGE